MKSKPKTDILERHWDIAVNGHEYLVTAQIRATVYTGQEVTGELLREISLELDGFTVDQYGEPVDDPAICRMIRNECMARIREDYLDLCDDIG